MARYLQGTGNPRGAGGKGNFCLLMQKGVLVDLSRSLSPGGIYSGSGVAVRAQVRTVLYYDRTL